MFETPEEIAALMTALGEQQRAYQALLAEKEATLPAYMRQTIEAIDQRFAPQMLTATEAMSALSERIKEAVIDGGVSVKIDSLQAVYSRGRVSWDDKFLQGYAAAHPEIFLYS